MRLISRTYNLGSKLKFQKLKHDFVDERAMVKTTLISYVIGKHLYLLAGESNDLKTHF